MRRFHPGNVPRKRQIKPSIFANEELGAETTDPLMMVLFAALWCLADREGRLDDRPAKIVKGFAFPYRDIPDPDGMLQWLHDHGFIIRYWLHAKRYIQICTWKEHQDIHPHEARSVIPAIPADSKMSLNVMTSPDIGDQRLSNVMFKNPLTSYPSSTSFPSLEEGAAIAAVDTAPLSDTAQQSDPVHRRIWTDGEELLTLSGLTTQHARSLLGRWAKDHGRIRLAEAIAATQAANPPNPRDYIGGVLRRMKNGSSDQSYLKGREMTPEEEAAAMAEFSCTLCFDYGTVLVHSNDVDAIGGMVSVACACGQPARKAFSD